MPVGSGKVTFDQRPEGNKGSDCQVPYHMDMGGGMCVCVCCKTQLKPEDVLVTH